MGKFDMSDLMKRKAELENKALISDEHGTETANVEILPKGNGVPQQTKRRNTARGAESGAILAAAGKTGPGIALAIFHEVVDMWTSLAGYYRDVRLSEEETKRYGMKCDAYVKGCKENTKQVKKIVDGNIRQAEKEAEKHAIDAQKQLQEFIGQLEERKEIREQNYEIFKLKYTELKKQLDDIRPQVIKLRTIFIDRDLDENVEKKLIFFENKLDRLTNLLMLLKSETMKGM